MTGNLPQPTPPSTTFIVIIHFGWLFVAFVAIMIPISLMNRALKESEEAKLRAEATLHHSHQLMGLLEPNGNVITINETALSFVDISRSEVVGKPFVETPWWPDEEKPRLSLALSKAAEGEHSAFKTWHMRQDGNKRIIDFCVGPYRDESGDIVYLIAEGRDVTELVKAEEQLAHREKLESVGELAGGIAHDFNNMLGGIIGAAECIATVKNPDDELFQKSLNILFTSSERAAALASKLLVFSRREQGRVEHCDFRNLLDDTAALLEHSVDKRINILVEHTDAETWVEGDTSQLQNVLLNLGINARDAMPDGGQLKMSTRMVQLDAAFCEQHPFDIQPGRYVQLSVSDTGVGMSPEIQKRVFEPFFTTKERGKGTGLGLSMVYGSVVAHKGAITVYSDLGRGTVFHILLPAMNPPGAVSSSPQQKLVFHDQGRVLLIDDEEVIRHTCQAMLNAMGYEVIEATNGLGGISIFEQQHRELKFVIVDMMMPEMNGRETLHRIRQISPEMKVIMMSGFAPDSTIAALRDDGADCFLSKPVHRDDLIQAIKSILSM